MTAPTTEKPKRRRARRVFVGFSALILAGVASIWLLPWLLMPEDLRRMQGQWQLLDPDVEDDSTIVTISGGRLAVSDEEAYLLRLEPESRKLAILTAEENEFRFLGVTMQLPFWHMTPVNHYVCRYEVTDDTLVLHLTGTMEKGVFVPEDEYKIHLKRK